MNYSWFDSHCHFSPDKGMTFAADSIRNAQNAGVAGAVVIGTSMEDCAFSASLTSIPGVFATAGIHPEHAAEPFDIARIKELLAHPKVVAVGEIGLDYFYDTENHDAQKKLFATFLELAVSLSLPAVIHCREAFQDCYDIVSHCLPTGHPFIIHSFTGTPQEAAQWLERGAFLSANGMLTFKKALNIRLALHSIPLERLLLETDSPFLAPVPLRGHENSPANIPIIGQALAHELNISPDTVAMVTTNNSLKFFNISNPKQPLS